MASSQPASVSFNFKGKKALVTGGSKGIGLAIVEALSEAGIEKVYVIGRDQKALDEVKSRLSCVETITADVGNWNDIRQKLETVEPVHFLINNAGTNFMESFYDVKEESFDNVFNVNVKSVINVSQVMCKKMKDLKDCAVVNVSSVASKKSLPAHLCYCASKAALDSVTSQMAFELSPAIRVNSVNPTVVLTELGRRAWENEEGEKMKKLIPMGRFAELDEVVKAVLFLLTDGAGMVQGHKLSICGGVANV